MSQSLMLALSILVLFTAGSLCCRLESGGDVKRQ